MATNAVQLNIEEFCEVFLPPLIRPTRLRSAKRNPFAVLHNANEASASDLSRLLVDSVNRTNLISGSTFSFFQPHTSSAENSGETVYTAIFRGRYTPRSRRLPSWTDQAISVEVKSYTAGIDPFGPACPEDDNTATEQERRNLFHQITTTARLLFAAQHRTFLFMLLVIGRRFRLLRWDHSGVIVTPSIDYVEDAVTLCDLLWRISRLDDVALGMDVSATRIDPGKADYLLMDAAALQNDDPGFNSHNTAAFEYARSLFQASLADGWPRYKLEVPDDDGTRQYLVGKPTFISERLVGRGTRGYVALDCTHNRFVWLKDTWRASYLLADKEGDILRRLNTVGIENVPTLVCHGDICDQVTTTIDKSARILSARPVPPVAPSSPPSGRSTGPAAPNNRKRKRVGDVASDGPTAADANGHQTLAENLFLDRLQRLCHTHYRIVMEEVCVPLKRFENSHQLVSIVLDCLRAHYQVASNPKTRLLHRDISMGNMLMFPNAAQRSQDGASSTSWTGILSDWEMSKPMDDGEVALAAPGVDQIGTYQFMSVNSLQRPSQPLAVADELESFFHVLLYFAVRFLRSNCSTQSEWIDSYFHNYAGPEHMHACGQKSITIEVTGQLRTQSPLALLRFDGPLDTVFAELLPCFKARYKVLNHELEIAADPSPADVPIPPAPAPAPAPAPPPSSPPERRFIAARRRHRELTDEDLAIRAQIRAELDNWAPPDNTPSTKERELASKLADHTFMIKLLERVLRDGDWPEDDRIAATQPVAGEPKPGPERDAPLPPSPPPKRKRQRTVGPQDPQALPTTTTRRTRSQARVAGPVRKRSKR